MQRHLRLANPIWDSPKTIAARGLRGPLSVWWHLAQIAIEKLIKERIWHLTLQVSARAKGDRGRCRLDRWGAATARYAALARTFAIVARLQPGGNCNSASAFASYRGVSPQNMNAPKEGL